jgi:chromate transporter
VIDLVATFLLVGVLAFGGGQAALPLVERLTIAQHGWLTPGEFAIATGLSYATPGPVLIISAFIGYHVAGLPGALAAAAAVFAVPVLAATAAARTVDRLAGTRWLPAFGRTAGTAAIGLLTITLVSLARPITEIHPALLLGSLLVALAARRLNPLLLLAAATVLGATLGAITG